MKICLVGPSYPFRGGISHYTTLLYRALKEKHHVWFFAFKRQYPRWLFPGKTDKDLSNLAIKEEGVENILEPMNPFSWLAIAYKVLKIKPDLLIFPWWVSFWTPQFWTIATIIKRLSDIKILFLCHNVVEHESNGFTRICTKFILKKGDYFIVHSQEDMDNLTSILPHCNVKKSFHPTYDVFNFNGFNGKRERKKLGLKGHVMLFFGFIREYKGLKYLIEALPFVISEIPVTLLIVGEFWEDKKEYIDLIKSLGVEEHVKVIDEYVPNEMVCGYFAASDIVVLPYISGTGSGIVQIAYGFNKPVIATRVGALPEVVLHNKTGYLVNPARPLELAQAIKKFFKSGNGNKFFQNIQEQKERFSWDRMVEAVESFSKSRA